MERAEFDKWKPKEVARLLALVETERRYYQEIVANIPVSLLIVGENLDTASANRQFRMRTGRKSEDIVGRHLNDLLPIDGLHEIVERVIQSGLGAPRQEMVWEGKPVLVTVTPLRSWEEDSGAESLIVIEGGAGTSLNSEQQKALEVQSAIDGILWEFNCTTSRPTYVNETAEEMFGHPRASWIADKDVWPSRVAGADQARVTAFYEQLASTQGNVFSIEHLTRRSDGHEFWAR